MVPRKAAAPASAATLNQGQNADRLGGDQHLNNRSIKCPQHKPETALAAAFTRALSLERETRP